MDTNSAKKILERYREGNCTEQETTLILEWYHQLIDTGEWQWEEEEKQLMQQSIENNLLQHISSNVRYAKVRHFNFRRWAVAASILLVLGLGSYFMFFHKTNKSIDIVKVAEPVKDVKAPETNRAMITLANGQQVYLDSVMNGTLFEQAGVEIVKLADGKIEYKGAAQTKIYNTLSNPRGSKVIDMTLADGSRVWLNAGSSVTYPIAFVGNERKVSITGEAYFEVAPDKSKPFYVSKGDMQVQVLGTHFNVNAYEDETDIKVTLIEGSVKINKGNSTILLQPGEQALIDNSITLSTNADIEQVLAWKNGFFSFNRADIKTVMRQLGRWYDVEVVYEGALTKDLFGGDIQRNLSLEKVLDFLEKSQVHFVLNGKTVTVKP
jgi:transmembrane sensor